MRARFRSISTRRKIEDSGFSFIELLAYMAIAALLILAAIPQFNQYREKAAISNLQSDARNVATTIEADYTTSLAYPSTIAAPAAQVLTIGAGSTQKLTFSDEAITYSTNGTDYAFKLTATSHTSTEVVYSSKDGGLQPVGTAYTALVAG
ncbi:hypothetical protein GCM10025867_48530 (plasmid) [Frondihabitans sucicola]|uniref:Prepilin-type N-terminal cleavage/methylation domain-containing protein n=1 Tax=Frondihabitans sucicola TaxID=1268041 RepID=A0ABN6Y5J6_9MICO|nr:prepilin-type N-terminal cleavage/methylation domain-containing protein [Frondihabitans sucicola]BDZ52612.1 hypothetical protein GCM10025867_48530 [Frondihabitans sucicola]